MKKLFALLIIIILILFGCTAPNNNDDLPENPPVEEPSAPADPNTPQTPEEPSDPSNPPSEEIPEEPVSPPKKPDETEFLMLQGIRNSSGKLISYRIINYLESYIGNMTRNNAIITSLPGTKYIIDSSENGKSIKGVFYVLDRIDNQFTWEADITSYELIGNHERGEYKISGKANYTGVGNDDVKTKFVNGEIKNYLQNYEDGDDDPRFLITEGNFIYYTNLTSLNNQETGNDKLLSSIYLYCNFIDNNDKSHIYEELFNTYNIGDPHGETLKEGYEKLDGTYFWPWWLPY